MSQEKPTLDEAARVTAVMSAAGRSPRVATFLPAKYQAALSALCDVDGKAVPNVRDKVISILSQAGKENKAEGLLEIAAETEPTDVEANE